MSDQQIKNLRAIKELIYSAETSLNSAKKLLANLVGEGSDEDTYDTSGLSTYDIGESKIIEGVFTGDAMLGSDGNVYPVPQNYASKSLLVQGSRLKATIDESGKIKYKIIDEIPYETRKGIVTKNGEKYQITTDTKTYNVLIAAITFHKCEIGDTVTIRIPEGKDATYAVIENLIPKL